MSNEPKHTATPWEIDDLAISSVNSPEDGGDLICEAPIGWEDSMKRWESNAARIVQCVNEYDGLIETIESLRAVNAELIEALRAVKDSAIMPDSVLDLVETTLAKYEKP